MTIPRESMVERSHQRFPVFLSGALYAYDKWGPYTIRLVDLSRNGCRIENTAQIVPGMNIALFLLPPGEDIPILIHDAKVRWSGAEGIGIEFHTVADLYRDRLVLLINQLRKPH
jgi:PilZ domain